jgi:hypothetical protein
MSGVKWDGYLGKKFESSASKRKRKAELEPKNLELSASLLKFLKRNDDASLSNKDLGENQSGEPVETKCDASNDEIVCWYRATAEATRPMSLKDHDVSEVAVEDQHKMLAEILESLHCENLKSYLESYDCEPEKISISCDPGE